MASRIVAWSSSKGHAPGKNILGSKYLMVSLHLNCLRIPWHGREPIPVGKTEDLQYIDLATDLSIDLHA